MRIALYKRMHIPGREVAENVMSIVHDRTIDGKMQITVSIGSGGEVLETRKEWVDSFMIEENSGDILSRGEPPVGDLFINEGWSQERQVFIIRHKVNDEVYTSPDTSSWCRRTTEELDRVFPIRETSP